MSSPSSGSESIDSDSFNELDNYFKDTSFDWDWSCMCFEELTGSNEYNMSLVVENNFENLD